MDQTSEYNDTLQGELQKMSKQYKQAVHQNQQMKDRVSQYYQEENLLKNLMEKKKMLRETRIREEQELKEQLSQIKSAMDTKSETKKKKN